MLSALLNLYLLKRLPYSVVIPLGSLTYIWTLIIARKYLGEAISKQKLMGILSILIGVILLTTLLEPIPELSARILPANFSSAFARKP
ncbi:MAG: EamA family transporter [Angelakisella sp.]|nr:EamA family transporter [Angelakisella sp.]